MKNFNPYSMEFAANAAGLSAHRLPARCPSGHLAAAHNRYDEQPEGVVCDGYGVYVPEDDDREETEG